MQKTKVPKFLIQGISVLFFSYIVLTLFATNYFHNKKTDELERVSIQLKWEHQFQFAGYYIAKEKGFYIEEGLDVEIREMKNPVNFVDEVISGKANYGIALSSLILKRNQGDKVVVLAPIFQKSPLTLISLKTSNINTPKDLEGKRIMIGYDNVELFAMLKKEGVNRDLIEIKKPSWNIESLLLTDEAEALVSYITNEPYVLQKKNIEYNILSPQKYGIDFYGDCLFTSEDEIKKHPLRVAAFRDASIRGWEYALNNLDEAVALIRNKYDAKKSIEALKYEAVETRKLISPDSIEIGKLDSNRWKNIAEIYVSLGLLSEDYVIDGFLYSTDSSEQKNKILEKIIFLFLIFLCVLYYYFRKEK